MSELRAAQLLRARGLWALPISAASLLVVLMTAFYFGALVDPAAHLHNLPVAVVDQDAGAPSPSGHLDLGLRVVAALTTTRAVTERLQVSKLSLDQAEAKMNRDAAFVAVVIPRDFTASALALVAPPDGGAGSGPPRIELLANDRAGTLGVSLAEGVLQPALSAVSRALGRQLEAKAAPDSPGRDLLADPVTVAQVTFRPLPSHSAVGLSAFYVALLIMMCGFLAAIIINTSVDAALGYASTEVGPFWRQVLPRPISRWQTLLAKWAIAVPATLVLTGLLLGVAVGLLHMDAPHWFELWMYAWFAAATIAIGTLVLFASLGALGQFLALLLFVYLGLASSGGTVPLQALNGVFQLVANVEPMHQILSAVRAILYFDAAGDAGLDRGLLLTAIGLAVWLLVGVAVTVWYDRRGLRRLTPEHIAIVEASVLASQSGRAGPRTQPKTHPDPPADPT